ncbi:sulfhydryl oxidase [Swinepox virus]|uniref:Sulfhydryl oxidase n=1 Tax=Swinepox virus TaxID=10276 RepID=A0A881SY15_SWPV|nr:sulfhydryl oxidase [Swinepox virus]
MNPKYWGRAIWTVIFIIITQTKQTRDVEGCKRKLYTIIDTLPCPTCRIHAKEELTKHNIMSSNDINYIYYFFIRLFNNLASDPKYKIQLDKVAPL